MPETETTRAEKRKAIQRILGVTEDGLFGPETQGAFEALHQRFDNFGEVSGLNDWMKRVRRVTKGKASSFADPADVRRFMACKAEGKTDSECFKVGDNGIGLWGTPTTQDRPMCALPRDDWQGMQDANGKLVRVRANGREVVCELRDTMPWRKNIRNGAVIDLNPAACRALGLTPPILVDAEWEWE